MDEIPVDMAGLFHHYYLDTRGHAPPDPDPALFEHLGFFSAAPSLRLKDDGIGTSLTFRISRSNDLGQAFCRWFLYTHLNITYFAHMHTLLNKPAIRFSGYTIERVGKGDTPDYFCAETRRGFFSPKRSADARQSPSRTQRSRRGESNSTASWSKIVTEIRER
jgi:hypothetical protein